MLDLSVIKSDEGQAVHCRTLEEARAFFFAVQEQRPDVSTKNWKSPPSGDHYANRGYVLSFHGKKQLLYGSLNHLILMGRELIAFEMLEQKSELPEINMGQRGDLSLFGL